GLVEPGPGLAGALTAPLYVRVQPLWLRGLVFLRLPAAALEDHAHRAPQGFAAPGVVGAAEQAGIEIVQRFFQLQIVVGQTDQAVAVLLAGPGFQRLARCSGLVGPAGRLPLRQGIALILAT